jgi:hypothetical protein
MRLVSNRTGERGENVRGGLSLVITVLVIVLLVILILQFI